MRVNVIKFLTVVDLDIDGETFAGGITRVSRAQRNRAADTVRRHRRNGDAGTRWPVAAGTDSGSLAGAADHLRAAKAAELVK